MLCGQNRRGEGIPRHPDTIDRTLSRADTSGNRFPAQSKFSEVFLLLLLQAYNINWQNTEYKLHGHKIKAFKQYFKKDCRQKLATNSTKITHQHKA